MNLTHAYNLKGDKVFKKNETNPDNISFPEKYIRAL